MKIGIEGQRLFREKKHGMDMVALELIRNLQKIDTKNEYFIFIKPDVDEGCLLETPNFKIVKLEGGSYPQWEQKALPKAAVEYGCDILHCTSNTAPLKGDIPLVVLVNADTASAAEIVAGSLQAQGRAAIIGTHTYGKDSIQLVFDLQDGSSIYVTAAKWWIPGLDSPIGEGGLQPDIVISADDGDGNNGDNGDAFIEAALQILLGTP